ncbi:hypothetical protein Microterr_13250 [Microbacterium terricola]|uniref:DUF4878 domain-containing protein n=2 Tax=Microbacterium terricola TaxID=344163 RepID=A0ABM8DYJ9_9MICO|nr:hypothetical protein Microterr_13250 [Microbacterium terricola]
MSTAPTGADVLTGVLRHVRRMDAAEAPWPGVLVRTADGTLRLRVDASDLGADWTGWGCTEAEHLLAPIDVLRTPEGHCVLLPVCTERLDAFLDRRQDAPLSAGEAVTLAVSVLRGAREAGADTIGQWWLTDGGRPVLATDVGDSPALTVTADLLRRLADDAGDEGALDAAARALRDDPFARVAWDALEAELFAQSEPRALGVAGPSSGSGDRWRSDEPAEVARAGGWLAGAIARHVDGELADMVSRATTGLWRRLRPAPGSPRGRRRGAWVAAAAACGVVLAVGMLWPAEPDAGEPATAAPTGNAAQPSVTATPRPPDAAPSAVASTDGDLDAAGDAVLTARTACAGEASCLSAVVEDPSRTFPAGVTDLPADQREITLLDSFGGAAVLRVDARARKTASQLIVLVARDGKWLLRDVHDVAEQP